MISLYSGTCTYGGGRQKMIVIKMALRYTPIPPSLSSLSLSLC